MYTLIIPTQLDYVPNAFDTALVDPDLIAQGNDCLGSASGAFADKGIWFPNKNNKVLVTIQNTHPTLAAYVRIPTSYDYKTLPLKDLIFEVAPNSQPIRIKGFSYIFHHLDEELGSNLIKINISHDSTEPTVRLEVNYV